MTHDDGKSDEDNNGDDNTTITSGFAHDVDGVVQTAPSTSLTMKLFKAEAK